jgi:hypothetical protein
VGYLLMTRTGWPTDPAGFSPLAIVGILCGFVLWILYWALTEGLCGASPGKAICRLHVVGPGRNVPGVPRALLRAVIFMILPALPTWIYLGFDPGKAATLASQSTVAMALSFSQFVLMALLFATVRRHNGFAGLHDLASGTRIIQKAAYEARPVLQPEEQPQPVSEATPKIGPYYILECLDETESGPRLLGYDTRLLRKVWIRRLPEGAPPAAAGVRSMGRATRLRWLGGSRAPGENWDAYEAPAGKPLLALIARPQPWRSVRYWLMDLAEELAAGLKDGSVPAALALDRVWITAGGRAKLLDFAAPGAGGAPRLSGKGVAAAADFGAARAFLNQVAVTSLEGRIVDADAARGKTPVVPVPLHARKFLVALPTFEGIEPLASGLKPLLQKVASVTPRRRLGLVGACAALPILMGGTMLLGLCVVRSWMESQPDIMPLQMCMFHLTAMEKQTEGTDQAKKVRAMEVYIAGRFGKAISDPVIWSSPVAVAITPDMRERARQIVAKYPNLSEKEIAEAKTLVQPFVGRIDRVASSMGESTLSVAAMQAGFGMMMPLAFGSIFCALVFRSGLAMLTFGVVAVKRDGSRAGRLRVFWRALVTWSPILFGLVALGLWLFSAPADAGNMNVVLGIAGGLALGLFAVLGVVSALLPERGLQDRLAGTWLVPR